VLVIACAHTVCGHQKNSKWSFSLQRSSRLSSRLSTSVGSWTERML